MPPALEKKIIIIYILITLLAAAAGTAVFLFISYSRAISAKDEFAQVMHRLEKENKKAGKELREQHSELKEQQEKIEQLRDDLRETRAKQEVAERVLNSKKAEIIGLQKRYEKRIGELERDIGRYTQFNQALTEALEPIRKALMSTGSSAASPGGSVLPAETQTGGQEPAGKTEVEPLAAVGSFDLSTGEVLSVNRKFGFVITSIGTLNGVQPGNDIQVFRQDKPLGLGRIEQVEDNLSVASIISEDVRQRVQSGDRVVLMS